MDDSLNEQIQTRGFYRVSIRPDDFDKTRVPTLTELEGILRRSAVSLRGWDFPHVGRDKRVLRGDDFIEQTTDWDYYREAWRFHQSGLFVFLAGYRWDWLDRQATHMPRAGWTNDRILPLVYVTYWVTEAFEFAARLAVTAAGNDRMTIALQFSDLQGRSLQVDDPERFGFVQERVADIEEWRRQYDLETPNLLQDPRARAREALVDLFDRFGWNPGTNILAEIQSGLRS